MLTAITVNKFQIKRLKNTTNRIPEVLHEFDTNHSIISVYIFLADFFSEFLKYEFTEEETILICNISLYFSYPIYKHHSSSLTKSQDDCIWNNKDLFDLIPYLSIFKIDLEEEQIDLFHNSLLRNANFDCLFYYFNSLERENYQFPLLCLIKLNFSLLTASDHLATAHYMNNWTDLFTDFCLIDDGLKRKIIYNAENYEYNKPVFESIESGELTDWNDLNTQSNINLNLLRKNIAVEVVRNIRENHSKNLFYIEAPTGGGKTNVSMLALSELLKSDINNEINKVFYVFPFTTLITQTCKSLQNTLGL